MITIKKGHFVTYLVLVAVVAGVLVFMSVSSAKAEDPLTVFSNSVDAGLTGTAADALESVEASSGADVAANAVLEKLKGGARETNVAEALRKMPAESASRVMEGMLTQNSVMALGVFSKLSEVDPVTASKILHELVRKGEKEGAVTLYAYVLREGGELTTAQKVELREETAREFVDDSTSALVFRTALAAGGHSAEESEFARAVNLNRTNAGLPPLDWPAPTPIPRPN